MKMLHCQDCLAYYSHNIVHVCPPWMKALVTRRRLVEGEVVRFHEDGSETVVGTASEKAFPQHEQEQGNDD